jgi:hypothetical protein
MQIKLLQTDWTQEQKNATHAAVAYLLHQMVASYSNVKVLDGLIDIETDEVINLAEEDIFTRILQNEAELAEAALRETDTVEGIKAEIMEANTPEQVDELLVRLRAQM